MARHTMMRPVRYVLVAALLGALLITTAGEAATVAAMILAPGLAPTAGTAVVAGPDTFGIPFATTALALDVDCGAPAANCSLWVARNNGAQATETLFANQTGSRTNIPVTFINDGCFNFRLYDSAHAQLYIQINIGHGMHYGVGGVGLLSVCNVDGTAQAQVRFAGDSRVAFSLGSGIEPDTFSALSEPVDWDSGFTGGVEDSQVWITQSQRAFSPIGGPAPGLAFTDCTTLPFPNGKEVLYAQNVSGEKTDLSLIGGGPYCFTLYQGTAHTTKIAGPTMVTIIPYLTYAGGAANPTTGEDNSGGTIYFSSGNGDTNALVCVHGDSIPGSDILHQTPFAFNSQGYGSMVASFQTVGAGVNKYTLHIGVGSFDASGNATPASCQTGTTPSGAAFFVHT